MEPLKVVFACTTLDMGSTLMQNFDTIDNKIRECYYSVSPELNIYLWEDIPKMAYIVFCNEVKRPDYEAVELLQSRGYEIFDGCVIQCDVIDYLKRMDLIADIIVSCQCNELVSLISGEKHQIGSENVIEDYNTFYNHLDYGGFFLNFGYGNVYQISNGVFEDVEQSYSINTIAHFLDMFFLLEMFKKDFEHISKGVYKKTFKINDPIRIYNNIKKTLLELLPKDEAVDIILDLLGEQLIGFKQYNRMNSSMVYKTVLKSIQKIFF